MNLIQNKNHSDKRITHHYRAFTLVETMIALVVFGIVGSGAALLTVKSVMGMHWSIKKSMLNSDFRSFTNELTHNAKLADFAHIYASETAATSSEPSNRVARGNGGNCLALAFTSPYPGVFGQPHFERVIIYYKGTPQNNYTPIYKTEATFDPANNPLPTNNYTNLEQFLAQNQNSLSTPEEVLRISTNRSLTDMFYAVNNRTFVINGEIVNGNKTQLLTNTYNLTISTKG